MHTFKGPKGTIFNYNSELSGKVLIHVPGFEPDIDPDEVPKIHLPVPGEDLLAFVAEFVRSQRIAALEQAEVRDVLGLSDRLARLEQDAETRRTWEMEQRERG